MLLINVDERRPAALHRQIQDQLTEKIAGGAVRAGEKLPSTRQLADSLGVHRSTVALAYQELWSLG